MLVLDVIYSLVILLVSTIILFNLNGESSNSNISSQVVAAFLFVISIKNIWVLLL